MYTAIALFQIVAGSDTYLLLRRDSDAKWGYHYLIFKCIYELIFSPLLSCINASTLNFIYWAREGGGGRNTLPICLPRSYSFAPYAKDYPDTGNSVVMSIIKINIHHYRNDRKLNQQLKYKVAISEKKMTFIVINVTS